MTRCSQPSSAEPPCEPTYASLKLHPLLSPSQEHVVRQFSALSMHLHEQQQCHQQQQEQEQHHHHHRHTASEPQRQLQEEPHRLHLLPSLKQNVSCVDSEQFMARVNVENSANAGNEAQLNEARFATSPASPGVELARLSPLFSCQRATNSPSHTVSHPPSPGRASDEVAEGPRDNLASACTGSAGSAPVYNSGVLPWLRNPSELDLNLPASLAGAVAATPPLAPSSAAFQVLNSSFWDASATCGVNGGAASPPVSEDSSESSLVECGSESSSTDMDDEEDNNEDGNEEDDEDDDEEADSAFKPLKLKKKAASPMASLPSKRSLSSHFGGKSRTFSSLADVSAIQSIHGLAKPPPGLCLRRPRRQSCLSSASSALRRSPCAIPIAAAHRSIGKHRLGAGSGSSSGSGSGGLGRLAAQQVQFSLALAVTMGSLG
ncbi:hypothetical protein CLOM_g9889 [Closterium sp. NIES-68]|nr:hypothetical protein CLOM_g9889 [Closterium sp. NIES-68]GJP75919.1 hypothetical protein CLOP_g6318 [Closterium sp. NIES-67]